ncbi:unnamed protein product [Tenebrio molitor]|nr:unnamed protein product [Tenebrio molitor]
MKVFVLLCLLAFAVSAVLGQRCGPGEEYSTCGNRCRQTCGSQVCPTVCQTGCFCRSGLFKNRAGRCVPPNQC